MKILFLGVSYQTVKLLYQVKNVRGRSGLRCRAGMIHALSEFFQSRTRSLCMSSDKASCSSKEYNCLSVSAQIDSFAQCPL